MYTTGVLRFDYQIAAVAHTRGIVLNIGANEDPAGLRARFGSRVINCDLELWDAIMERPNVVDRVFDCTEFPWPFDDDYAELVVLGDILEHFPYDTIVAVLREARRVGRSICVTAPQDPTADPELYRPGRYNRHVTYVTHELLMQAFADSGWTPYHSITADWGTNPPMKGFCMMGQREPESVGSVITK